jgi:RNA polymerase sigma factor (sigma-70 family)
VRPTSFLEDLSEEVSLSYLVTDPQMVLAARDGDAQALERLLAASRTQVIRFAERHCWVHDVEDAVQESLFQATRPSGKLRAIEAFAGWVFRIVKRECDRLKRGWRLHVNDYAPDQPLPEPVLRPADELRCDIISALRSLPVHYREVLLLRDAEELTIEEIAEHLAITRLAVKARLHRARVLVREYLE